MNITQENLDELNAVLKITIEENDYKNTVLDTLKKHQKSAKMDGFRPGKVPFGMVKKMYGTSVKLDEINKLINSKIQEHLTKNKVNVLGQPLPKEDTELSIDWNTQKDFEFTYEMGIAPEFDLKIDGRTKFTEYKVVPDDSLVENYIDEITSRYGKYSSPEEIEESDVVTLEIGELEGEELKEEGGLNKGITISLDRIEKKTAKKPFLGKKVGDNFNVDLKKLGKDIEESASLAGLKKEELEAAGDKFQVQVTKISRVEKAELNQELFDKVYGEGTVKSEEEFKAKVKEEAAGMLVGHGASKFKNDVIELLLDKTTFDLPDEFLKRWLVAVAEKQTTKDDIEKEYDQYQKSLKWQLIENKIITDNDIKVENQEVVDRAKSLIAANFAQFGQAVSDEDLNTYAQNILGKEEERRRIYEEIYMDKILDFVKKTAKVEEKEISYDDFIKLD
jgi:trigger factor